MSAFEQELVRASLLADELSAAGVRFRITLDDGDGLTAELTSSIPPKRVPRS